MGLLVQDEKLYRDNLRLHRLLKKAKLRQEASLEDIISKLKELLGDKPIVVDREFRYEELFQAFVVEGLDFVIRLNADSGVTFVDEDGDRVMLSICPSQKLFHRDIRYQENVKVNLAGEWTRGLREPLF